MPTPTCHYCGPTDEELRPYGPGGASVCYDCATVSPERLADTRRNFEAVVEAAEAMSPVGGVLLDEAGIHPLNPRHEDKQEDRS